MRRVLYNRLYSCTAAVAGLLTVAVFSPCCQQACQTNCCRRQYITCGLLTSTGMLLLPSQKGLHDHQERLFRKKACIQGGFSTPSKFNRLGNSRPSKQAACWHAGDLIMLATHFSGR